MKTSPYAKLFVVAAAITFSSCSSPPPTPSRVPVSGSLGSQASLAERVFAEVNSRRASMGKATLQRHPGLDRLAQKHCNYLVETAGSYGMYGKDISHIGFEGRALAARQAYKINSLGENVVSSTNHSAKHLVALWAGSKGHEHNMGNDWTCSGIATAVTPGGKVICTQLFATAPSTSHLTMKQRINREW